MSPSYAPSPRAHRGRYLQILGHVSPWLVLLLGLGGTTWAWRALRLQEAGFQAGRLESAVAQTMEAVDHRIEEQTKLLHASRGLVVGRPRLSAADWRAFVTSLEPRRLSPGTRLMCYVPREVLEGRRGAATLLEPPGLGTTSGADGAGLLRLPGFQEADRKSVV